MVGGGSESQGQGNLFASFILLLYHLGEASKIWDVARMSPGSRQEVARKSCLNCYRTRSPIEGRIQVSGEAKPPPL